MNKICFFVPSLNIGGVESVFITYANELAARGYRVHFLLCHNEGDLLPLVAKKVKIDDLGDRHLRNSLMPMRNYLIHNTPDVLITGGDFPNLMSIIAAWGLKEKPKVIISKHNYRNTETKDLGWWSFLDLRLQKILYPKADKIIAVSRGIKNYLIETVKINSEKVVLLHNPIDIDEIKKKAEENIDIILPDNYIVFVGRLSKVKNLDFLINAFDHIRDDSLHLVIVGDGAEKNKLEEYSKQKISKDKIHFVGSTCNPMPFINRSKALILCSLSEAYPTTLLEAMTLDTPIVATPTEGAKEILNGIEGVYLSDSFTDESEFSVLIQRAITSKPLDLHQYTQTNKKNEIINRLERILLST